MTLSEIFDQLDWSEIDDAHKKWEETHDGFSFTDLRQSRLEKVHYGIMALNGEADMGLWWVLPKPIRVQIRSIFEKNGLLRPDT